MSVPLLPCLQKNKKQTNKKTLNFPILFIFRFLIDFDQKLQILKYLSKFEVCAIVTLLKEK